MPIEIIIPRLGWSMEEGAFVAWLQEDGAFVQPGQPLFSIEGDKAIQEIDSIDGGILRILPNGPKPGDPIRVGDLLGHLLPAGEAVPGIQSKPAGPPAPAPEPPPSAAVPSKVASAVASADASALSVDPLAQGGGAPRETSAPAWPVADRTVCPTVSPRALRVAGELGVDWTRVTGTGRTGRVRERDIRAAAGLLREPLGGSTSRTAKVTPTVLVTGGCGFIGTWVVQVLLARDCRVVVLDAGQRPPRWERLLGAKAREVPLITGSLLDRDLLARVFAQHPVTHVIHLAALLTPDCQSDPWHGCQVNVLGTVALLEQVRATKGQIRGFSYASSVAVFGDEPDTGTAATGTGPHPTSFYGAFKKAVESIAQQYWRHFRIASMGIRPQVAYGPERETGLTAGPTLAARAAVRGEPYRIGYTGRVGYDYVEDVAEAFVRGALETPAGAHVVDLPGETADVAQVLAAIATAEPKGAAGITIEGSPIPAMTPPEPHSIATLYPDWTTTSLVEGIARTVEYYRRRH